MSWKCTKCGSDDVQYLDWIDMNTGEAQADGLEEFYCGSCEAHTDVVFEDSADLNSSENER